MLTLLEKAKLSTDPLQKGVIMTFAETSPILERLQFQSINSDTYRYNRTAVLPNVAFRALNSNYTESTGQLDYVTEPLTILGGCSDVDRVLELTSGDINSVRAVHDSLLAKSLALRFQKEFIKGSVSTDPKSFNGLQARCTGNQLIAAGTGSGGDTLTLPMIDELIDSVEGDNKVLIMNKTLRRKTNSLVRAAGSAIETVNDSFGRQLMSYAGTPILVLTGDETNTEILPFTEACPVGASAGTSVYCVSFGIGQFCWGLECGGIATIDHGLYSGGTAYRTTVEWIVGFTLGHTKSAARLYGVKNA